MRQGCSTNRLHHLRVVGTAVAVGDEAAARWPAWASLLLVLGAGLTSWSAIVLTVSTLAD
jgi:hypothetical protein